MPSDGSLLVETMLLLVALMTWDMWLVRGGGSIVVSYGYSVDGIRYYGAFNPSLFEEIGLFNF